MKTTRTAKWHKKLTLKEVAHCKEHGGLNGLKKNLPFWDEEFEKNRDNHFNLNVCWTCLGVVNKLGLKRQEVA
tara:strand:+ start:235 stop:453 length:219 start_codon:yes stop_codon:yes gene_type:complete